MVKLAKPESWENVRVVTSVKTSSLTYEELDIPSCYYADGDIQNERESIAHELEAICNIQLGIHAETDEDNENLYRINNRLKELVRVLRAGSEAKQP